jgi:hypothetical protein
VTTGAPIFLVTACASPEEFFAAFRRYADRAGLFVPAAQPVPAGRRGRFALTLKDGGVMIEGDAEVLQSSSKPQGLYGRAGMTIKFVELDDPSRTVLGELEKARFAVKPLPSQVPPRPAQIPATPRPVPPKPIGRIDPANSLAECVVIGDLGTLSEMRARTELPRAGQKFVTPMTEPVADPVTTGPALDSSPDTEPTKRGPPVVVGKVPMLGMPALPRTATLPFGVPTVPGSPPSPRRAQPLSTPSLVPRQPTPVVPLPIVQKPRTNDPATEPSERPSTVLGVAAPTGEAGAFDPDRDPTDESVQPQLTRTSTERDFPPMSPAVAPEAEPPLVAPSAVPPLPAATTTRSGGMRASEIMAAIPTDDWTMTPDASAPTVTSPPLKPSPLDGWAPPNVKRAHTPSGNPVHAMPEKAREVVDMGDMPTHLGDKIEVDPSLVDADTSEPEISPPPTPAPPKALPGTPSTAASPLTVAPSAPGRGKVDMTNTSGWFRDSQEMLQYPAERDPADAGRRRRRLLFIVGGAAVATLAIVVGLILVLGSRGKTSADPGSAGTAGGTDQAYVAKQGSGGSGSDETAANGSGAGSQAVTEPVNPTRCSVDLTSVPTGAQIVLDDNTIAGSTPATVEVPCGAETKLTLKKLRYLNTVKTVTANEENTKLDPVKLGRAQLSVKVTSTPPGAAITVGGRSMGVTPTMIKLPAFETSHITLTKDGYATESEPFVPKVNGAPLHVTLKRGSNKHH